jgi:predicted dehydrogenase
MNYLSSSEVTIVKSLLGFEKNKKFEDNAIIMLEYGNGIKCVCEVNWLTPVKVRELTLTFDDAFVIVNLINQTATIINHKLYNVDEKNLFKSSQKLEKKVIKLTKEEPLKLEILDFLDSINFERDPFVNGKDGLKALEIVRKSLE